MKKSVLSMVSLCSLLFAGTTIAVGPSADIKVIGELVAPTCDVALTNNGAFDYGNISHSKIQSDRAVSLGSKTGSLTVTCTADTPLTFKVTDNRLGTASQSGTQYLGLGAINGTGKMGYYTVKMYAPTVDGKMANIFVTANSSIPSPSGIVTLEHGKRIGWVPNGAQELAIGKKFNASILAEAFLAKRSDMHGGVGDESSLDGSATLEFDFGL
jgi:hypothetical protein